MRDSEVVASIVAGNPEGLAAAYDRYADALFGYCRTMLREPADAADAVQDTFVIAASRLSGLRDPDLLRPWLFAVARNESLRKLKSRQATSALDDDAEHADETADVGEQAERAETRALLVAAVDGLNSAERDVVTQLLHGLDIAEIAIVLGISRNHAHSLLSRARQQLEASIAVLLVARSGRQDCAELDTLLAGWDGRLTVLLRKQLSRHIAKCEICGERRRRELTPAMLLGLGPAALLGALAPHAASAEHAAPAAAAHAAPAGLRDQALRMATNKDLHAAAYRGALRRSHAPFGQNGFPKPLHASHHLLARVPRGRAVAAGGAAAVVAAAIIVATLAGQHHARFSSGGPLPGGGPTIGQPRGGPSGTAPGTGTAPGGAPSGGSVSAGVSSSGPGAPGTPGVPNGSGSPTPAVSGTTSPSGSPTSPAPTGSGSPTRGPTSTPTTPAPPPPAGTLDVSPTSITLTPLLGSTLTLTAQGGPVNWSISEPSSLLGELVVSPMSGTLAAGQSAQVTITVSGLASLDTQLTVNPGGHQVTVVLGLL